MRCSKLMVWPLLSATVVWGCGPPTVPEPEPVQTRKDFAVEVSHPPPAALPEIVPPAPNDEAVWLDGHWVWQQKTWVWLRGGWVEPPADAELSRWAVWYEPDGRLFFADDAWFWSGRRHDAPPITKPAGSPPTPKLPEDATTP